MTHSIRFSSFTTLILVVVVCLGCSQGEKSASVVPPTTETAGNETSPNNSAASNPAPEPPPVPEAPVAYEIKPDQLLAAALSEEQLQDGWVRMFDGQSLFGWYIVGKANWRIEDEIIKVDGGERSYLCSSYLLTDYEFKVDFRSDAKTNSGIFLRTDPQPEDVAVTCLELNIAPEDNPYPTGSLVERQKLEPSELGEFDPTQWHTYHVRMIGNSVEILLDDRQIMKVDELEVSPTGHISLQHNSGLVEFRNILLKPIDGTALKLDADWEEDWTKSEKEEGVLAVEIVDDGLKMTGGLGQLQSKSAFGNFILQAQYTLAKPEVNSGIFFRCVPEGMLDGYECQVNHAVEDGDPLRPGDAGAGAIFRRQPARIVMGDGTQRSYVTILANGSQVVTWVNGVQVTDFYDSREPDPNPRKGSRTEAGPIALQGHDPTTEVTFHSIVVSEL